MFKMFFSAQEKLNSLVVFITFIEFTVLLFPFWILSKVTTLSYSFANIKYDLFDYAHFVLECSEEMISWLLGIFIEEKPYDKFSDDGDSSASDIRSEEQESMDEKTPEGKKLTVSTQTIKGNAEMTQGQIMAQQNQNELEKLKACGKVTEECY